MNSYTPAGGQRYGQFDMGVTTPQTDIKVELYVNGNTSPESNFTVNVILDPVDPRIARYNYSVANFAEGTHITEKVSSLVSAFVPVVFGHYVAPKVEVQLVSSSGTVCCPNCSS